MNPVERTKGMYVIGADFGTLSCRGVLVAQDGTIMASASSEYPHGVIESNLSTGAALPPFWALHHPADYLETLVAVVAALLDAAEVDPVEVSGIGIDATASSPLPVDHTGKPLLFDERFTANRHAYVKLWKHHAAQPQADRINSVATERQEAWLARYGGRYSAEWYYSKLLEILDDDPKLFASIGCYIEVADWVVWQLVGRPTVSACTAGYKMLRQDGRYPTKEYLESVRPGFSSALDMIPPAVLALGAEAGGLTPPLANRLGLEPGTSVAVANVDAHVTAPAVGATGPGTMVMVIGTSTCHIVQGHNLAEVDGMCGVVDGGVVDGLVGYEAGQNAVGDTFAWFIDNALPEQVALAAAAEGVDIHTHLQRHAAELAPGAAGMVALDWFNGNRSTLVDADLTGAIFGASLATTPYELYRTLIEATAFGTRKIVTSFRDAGVPVERLVAAGGIPQKNPLLLQIYADVLGIPIDVAAAPEAPALGSAIHAAVAAGLFPSVEAASVEMAPPPLESIDPNPAAVETYDLLFTLYERLYEHFGRHDDLLHELRDLRRNALSTDPKGGS